MNRRSTSRALATAVGALCALVVLTGCSGAGGEATASVRSTTVATPAPTVTVTATPAPVTPSPDDPIDAMGAWTACAVLGLAEYAGENPGSELRPYDPANPPFDPIHQSDVEKPRLGKLLEKLLGHMRLNLGGIHSGLQVGSRRCSPCRA